MPQELPPLVQKAAQLLDAALEEEAEGFYLTVGVTESEDDDEDDRTQLVRVEVDEEGEVILISTDVGPFDEDLDLAEVLRLMRDAVFSRVYVAEGTADEPEQLVVESALVLEKADPDLLASMVQEVAEVADELELLLFDEDEGDVEDEDE